MESREGAKTWGDGHATLAAQAVPAPRLPLSLDGLRALAWAGTASTLHRVWRGEGALLAINLSLIAWRGLDRPQALAEALVSLLVIGLMYAVNDLWDAPTDANNPKKDRAVIAAYLAHRRAAIVGIVVLKALTLGFAAVALGAGATAAVAATMLVNVVYSGALKGVPVVDVAWCGVWGASYAAITGAPLALLVVVGLMTAICHLYQALDDRAADAANAITTTAVRSPALSRHVLVALSMLTCAALWAPLGPAGALTAFVPLAVYALVPSARIGWLLTKVYFGAVWLWLLGVTRALG
jgi:4-hydroxybenzoate polyprenyltransferase